MELGYYGDDRETFEEWEHRMEIESFARKKQEKIDKRNAKDDALVTKIMAAIDAKYGHLLDRSDLNQIIKESK